MYNCNTVVMVALQLFIGLNYVLFYIALNTTDAIWTYECCLVAVAAAWQMFVLFSYESSGYSVK